MVARHTTSHERLLLAGAMATVFLFIVTIYCLSYCYNQFTLGPSHRGRWEDYSNGLEYLSGACVAPSGDWVAYSTPTHGNGDICKVNTADNSIVTLTQSVSCEAEPTWAHNAPLIAYCREGGSFSHIWIMNDDGSGQKQITVGNVYDSAPAFSADDERLVFCREDVVGNMYSRHLVVRTLASGEEKRIHVTASSLSSPTFSPDGDELVVASFGKIIAINLKTGSKTEIAEGYCPRFCYDGSIIFVSPEVNTAPLHSILRLSPNRSTTAADKVSSVPMIEPSLSRNGLLVFIEDKNGTGSGILNVLDTNSGGSRELIDIGAKSSAQK
jgi:dipeptidyl aminopeptidase/acylaminoacyl peptidase